jgi:CarD family transcriptional regulator
LHQQELKEKGKKLRVSDERFLKDAEKVLYDEFAHVLDIKREEVLPFIFEQIETVRKQG